MRVDLERGDNQCIVRVVDDGKGVPDHILPKLGTEGFSYEKTGGSGLGLYQAKSAIEACGGTLHIHSRWEEGTTVTISLPQAAPPVWFLPQLEVEDAGTVVILDDEPFLHEVWKRRFRGKKANVTLVHFTSGEELIRWVGEENPSAPILYLCDYELKGEAKKGIEIIQALGINDSAILVTGHAYSSEVRTACEKRGIRLIPKELAPDIPIHIRVSTGKPMTQAVELGHALMHTGVAVGEVL